MSITSPVHSLGNSFTEFSVREKKDNLVGDMAAQGTTPRKLTDLIGSLCDLTSGSGDTGTPVILIHGMLYFFNRRHSVRVCPCTPSIPFITNTATSNTWSVRSKYLADNDFKDLSGEALKEAIENRIREKKDNLVGDMAAQLPR